jgi:hypothetical protein
MGCIEWIHLAEDRDLWRDLANTVMNFRGFIRCEILEQASNWWLLKKDSSLWSAC